MPAEAAPASVCTEVGPVTLERLAAAPRFHGWMYERLAPWIGRRVLEIGSGIGNLSQFLVGRERVILSDTEAVYRARLARRFAADERVSVTAVTLPAVPAAFRAERIDTVVCLNVLEHVEDDEASLHALREVLVPGGRLVLLVPALPRLYGSLDRALGHRRRYTPASLGERYGRAGLDLRHLEYFNLAGIPGWWFVGRVLRRPLLPAGSLRLYNTLVPLFRAERWLPRRVGLSLIAIGERSA